MAFAIPHGKKATPPAGFEPIFDFTLTADEVAAIDALDKGGRGGPDPETLSRQTHPFAVDNS